MGNGTSGKCGVSRRSIDGQENMAVCVNVCMRVQFLVLSQFKTQRPVVSFRQDVSYSNESLNMFGFKYQCVKI